mmetsp:Transcript_12343/g.35796  ORF Transcript_12343/g.35796 Transcript_12343/m.35796 type:complete len:544 (-) Transcript_12343:2202-3833(-)
MVILLHISTAQAISKRIGGIVVPLQEHTEGNEEDAEKKGHESDKEQGGTVGQNEGRSKPKQPATATALANRSKSFWMLVVCALLLCKVCYNQSKLLLAVTHPLPGQMEDASSSLPSISTSLPSTSSSKHVVVNSRADQQATQQEKRWAYAYLLAGCDPDSPGTYLGMMYNALVSARLLQEEASVADVVVMIEMHYNTSYATLPAEHERLLNATNIKIKYLPQPRYEPNFFDTMMRKFDLLQYTEYSRILYMDADVMPFCSLDYLFQLSDPDPQARAATAPGQAKATKSYGDNVVLTWKIEPAAGGFFMLRPGLEWHRDIQQIIRRRLQEAVDQPKHLRFNETIGWGHVFEGGDDTWSSLSGVEKKEEGKNGTVWSWYGAIADQGLLYYWTKYHRRNVSIIIGDKIEHWVDRNGTAVLDRVEPNTLRKDYSCNTLNTRHLKRRYVPHGAAPYSDFKHFTGGGKPWRRDINKTVANQMASNDEVAEYSDLWWKLLVQCQRELNFTVEFDKMKQEPAYGLYPLLGHLQGSGERQKTDANKTVGQEK